MTEDDIKKNWNYFKSLAKQFQQTEQFVDHSMDSTGKLKNEKTFSNEFAKLLLLSASEFEVIAKALCSESGHAVSDKANITEISKTILYLYPSIINSKINTPYQITTPLAEWSVTEPNSGLPWWKAYNKIKHDRTNNFESANLNNCLNALASLMVLELYLAQIVLRNLDSITPINCDYFDCEYGLAVLAGNPENGLPDF